MAYLMGIDLGTSATKTQLFNEQGQSVASASREYPVYQPHNGWNEQRPEDWWQAVLETIREVFDTANIANTDVSGIGISGQMHGLVMLDAKGDVIRPAIIWSDQRTAKECEEITERVGKERLLEITANPALPGFTAAKILWVRNNEPENYLCCRKILLPKDYIRYKLSGIFATEVSDASGMQLLNIAERRWSDEVLQALDIDRDLLAEVYESPEVTAEVSAQAAKLTGLRPGTPIVGGAGDNAAAAVGTAVVREGRAFTTIGSSGVVFAHTDQMKRDPKGRAHTFCCAVPGAWHVMGVTQAAGLSYKWFRDNFCEKEIAEAHDKGVDPYQLMDEMAASRPIGSNRLIYLPYLNGERTPHLDSTCRGVFFGLSSFHEKSDLARAVLEGVSFSQLDCLNIMRDMNLVFDDMRVTGGGASPFWQQMLADVYNLKVSSLVSSEGPALGVALLAGVGTGIYQSVEEACDMTVKLKKTVIPDPEAHKLYREYYKLYRELYPQLKEQWQKLAKLPT